MMYMDFSTLTPCWFNLRDNTKSNNGRNTEKWSLKQKERKSGPITTGAALPSSTATSSTATSTAATTSRSSSSTSTEASATTTAAIANAEASGSDNSSSSTNSNDGDISAGAKAGLGIGVGIGTSLLCAGAFWLYYRHVKRKEHHQEVYRRIVGSGGQGGGGGGGGAGPYAAPNNNSEHLEPWRYGGTPQPAPSAWSGVSDPSTTDWYVGHQTNTTGAANAPYQYYDPVGSTHQLGAMAGAAGIGASAGSGANYQYQYHHHQYSSQPSVTTTASMTAEPAPSLTPRAPPISIPQNETAHVPEAAAIRDVQDLSSSLFPSEYNNNDNEPVSPVSATAGAGAGPGAADRSIPPTRVASVNYGPNGPRDASTGADFSLLPDYTAPAAGGTGQEGQLGDLGEEDDIYGPPTPRSPPPPHSAHAHIAAAGGLPQQQQQTGVVQPEQQGWQQQQQPGDHHAVELPTAQTHRRGYGPEAELDAGHVAGAQPPPLRQQRSDLRVGGMEQKVLLEDVAALRRGGQEDGG